MREATVAGFIIHGIKKEALLYIIRRKNQPVCFFLQGVELFFCFKSMSQNSCFVCQGLKWRSRMNARNSSVLCCCVSKVALS